MTSNTQYQTENTPVGSLEDRLTEVFDTIKNNQFSKPLGKRRAKKYFWQTDKRPYFEKAKNDDDHNYYVYDPILEEKTWTLTVVDDNCIVAKKTPYAHLDPIKDLPVFDFLNASDFEKQGIRLEYDWSEVMRYGPKTKGKTILDYFITNDSGADHLYHSVKTAVNEDDLKNIMEEYVSKHKEYKNSKVLKADPLDRERDHYSHIIFDKDEGVLWRAGFYEDKPFVEEVGPTARYRNRDRIKNWWKHFGHDPSRFSGEEANMIDSDLEDLIRNSVTLPEGFAYKVLEAGDDVKSDYLIFNSDTNKVEYTVTVEEEQRETAFYNLQKVA